MPETEVLTTVDEVIDCLGGNKAVADEVGLRTYQAVWEWRNRGIIPARFYQLMIDRLRALGKSADPRLWGQVPALDPDNRSDGDAGLCA